MHHISRFTHRHILRERAAARAEHVVAGLEALHILADSFHGAGEVHAETAVLGRAEPAAYAYEVRLAAHVVPVERIHRRCVNFDEDLIGQIQQAGELPRRPRVQLVG